MPSAVPRPASRTGSNVLPEAAIEALHKAVLLGLAGRNEVQRHAMVFTPLGQRLCNKFRSVVYPNRLRQGAPAFHLLKCADHTSGWHRRVHLDGQCFPIKLVDQIQRPELAAIGQAVTHEVHRPAGIGRQRCHQRLLEALRQAVLHPAPQVQTQLLVDAINPLVVPGIAHASGSREALAKASPWAPGNTVTQEVLNDPIFRVRLCATDVIPTAAGQIDNLASHAGGY